MTELWLPWPKPTLSPNLRQHWSRLSKAKAKYREDCRLTVLAMKPLPRVPATGPLAILFEWCCPTRRDYDSDNLLSRMKAGVDGMCDALGFNDKRFRYSAQTFGPVVKGGAVRVRITAL